MRRYRLMTVFAVLALASCEREAAAPAPAPASPPTQSAESAEADSASAEAFVRRIYARFSQETAETAEAAPYSARLTALLAENARLTPAGDQGYLDSDPFCGCQDWDSFSLDNVAIIPIGDDRLDGAVTFTNRGVRAQHAVVMVREQGQWRVDDVISGRDGSVFAGLAAANAALAGRAEG